MHLTWLKIALDIVSSDKPAHQCECFDRHIPYAPSIVAAD
jgi:hypothetical protein